MAQIIWTEPALDNLNDIASILQLVIRTLRSN